MYWIVFLLGFILLGPIMYGIAKLNKIDPYILDKTDPSEDQKSFLIVVLLYPLFVPLFIETQIYNWFKTAWKKKSK